MENLPYYIHIGNAKEVKPQDGKYLYRALEIMPGVLAWGTIVFIILGSFLWPVFMAFFIIAFDVYWFIKTIYLSLHLRVAFNQMQRNLKINWLEKIQDPSFIITNGLTKNWQEIYHLILLPFYKEDYFVVKNTVESLLKSEYPKEKVILVLATEEKAGPEALKIGQQIERDYKDKFFRFLLTVHPSRLEREIAGKGSNIAWAGQRAKELIDANSIDYRNILVSALDIDTIVSSQYFARLTYVFLTASDPLRASYQPVPFYTNNIWEAPSPARVVAFSATFWHTIQQAREERLRTFSSHSMPFQALLDVNFWQRNMVSEDSRIFFQCFLRYDGNYRVVPLNYPVSMDANVAHSFWKTMVNVYKQQRRWGWGVENIPYLFYGFIKNKKIPFRKKLEHGFFMVEGFWSWSTNALIIFILGWLPVIVGGPIFNQTILSLNLPLITRYIMTAAMVGVISSAVLSIIILPPRPPQYGRSRYLIMVLQWTLMPVTMILLGALPGFDAQTRLMLGKYMGFWVTPKFRRNPETG